MTERCQGAFAATFRGVGRQLPWPEAQSYSCAMVNAYKEHSVDPRLAEHVACYWTHDVGHDSEGAYPVLPDGCIDVLFASRPRTLHVVGTMTRTLWAESCGPTHFVGIRFKAGGAVPFLRDRANLWTDGVAEADCVFGRDASHLKQQLLDAGGADKCVRVLERFLLGRLQTGIAAVDSRIAWAASKLLDDPGGRIEPLAHELGLSRQYVRRLFLEHTGLSPKVFARVARLSRLTGAVRAGVSLADASLISGYSDQAHMNHEFKSLVGMTPAAYRARL